MSVTLTRARPQVGSPGLPTMMGLDGLRAVAVAAVVLYHADVAWIPGGFLGVDVFFVLSGFLITSLLLVELERTRRLDLGRFYLRRARRLLPALFAVLVVTGLLVATVAYDVAAAYRRDLPGALLYFSNWSAIVTDTSYFEFIGRPTMLQHLWSLAVEEQFYLLWPVLCWVLFRWGGARRVGQVALIGALLSTLAMAVGSVMTGMPLQADPSRLYYGTDTHAMGVLLGAALAVVWRPGRTSPVLRRQAQVVITLGGILGLVLLGWAFTALGEYSTFLYRGGFLLVAGTSALVVAAASHRGVPFGAWLGNRPMRWLGRRSYGVYLWHWPLFLVTRPGVDIPLDGPAALVARLALLLGVAELSYRYLELPVRQGVLGRWWSAVRLGGVARPSRASAVAAVAVLLVGAGSVWRIAGAPAPAAAEFPVAAPVPAGELAAPLERDLERRAAALAAVGVTSSGSSTGSRVPSSARTKISAFGDSVLLGATPTLEARTFDVDLHARVGRQARAVEDSIRDVTKAGDLRPRVLIHTGTNGIVTSDELHGMLDAAKSADRVVISTVQVPRRWAAPNNTTIRKVAAAYDNAVVADWAKVSDGHREFFVKDGVHLTPLGAEQYNALIARAFGVATDPSGSS
jgi:peptidoglycan/LPS O-acetylase OafA/YrhL